MCEKNQKIKEIIESYRSIIDFDDSREVFSLIADLNEIMKEAI